MKRLAVGALVVSLLAGSVAMAGQGYRDPGPDRGNSHSDHRGGDRNDHGRNDRGHRDRGGDWNRGHDRHDWNDRRRDDHRGSNGRRDWNDGHRFDNHSRHYSPPHRYAPPRVYSPPRHYYSPPRHYYSPPRYYGPSARYHWGAYHRPYGFYSHRWDRGERLPVAYYAPRYVVYDYAGCGLRAPPYGYHWVRVDSDVVLAAIATGVILDVVYNRFY
jgi:Ni/Co efflux regulator RcnB